MLADTWHMIMTNCHYEAPGRIIGTLAFDSLKIKKKQKKKTKTQPDLSEGVRRFYGGKKASFSSLQQKHFQSIHYIVTITLLTTFSNCAIITILLIPLCGIHKMVTAKKAQVNLFQ